MTGVVPEWLAQHRAQFCFCGLINTLHVWYAQVQSILEDYTNPRCHGLQWTSHPDDHWIVPL